MGDESSLLAGLRSEIDWMNNNDELVVRVNGQHDVTPSPINTSTNGHHGDVIIAHANCNQSSTTHLLQQQQQRLQISPRMGTTAMTSSSTSATSLQPSQQHQQQQVATTGRRKLSPPSAGALYSKSATALLETAAVADTSMTSSCNGGLTNSAQHIHSAAAAPRIRTNGSLPRRPKPRPSLFTPGHAHTLLESANSKSSDDVITPSPTDSDDVYRPHTIPRRGPKMTLVEIN